MIRNTALYAPRKHVLLTQALPMIMKQL